jgi:hypothetical protein
LLFAKNDIVDEDDEERPNENTLAGWVYTSVNTYSNDMDFFDNIGLMAGSDYQRQQVEKEQGELCKTFDYISKISLFGGEPIGHPTRATHTKAFLGEEKEPELSQDWHRGWQGTTAKLAKALRIKLSGAHS